MATAGDLITAAFLKIGIDSPTAAQTASALISLNNMASLLGADLLPPAVVSESFSIVATDPEYTIGASGQWDTVRPMKVLSCFLRDDDQRDLPLDILSSKDYNEIYNKMWDATPTGLYFLPEYPLAKIIFNSRPIAGYDVYFEFLKNFTEFALTTTTMSLPNEYKEFFVYNLAVSLAEDWDRVVSKTVFAQSVRTREVIDRLNAAARTVPKAQFDFYKGTDIDWGFGGTSNDDLIDGGAF